MAGVRRYRDDGDGLSDGEAHGDKGITEVDWAMGSIYLAGPGVDRHYLILYTTKYTLYLSQLMVPCTLV